MSELIYGNGYDAAEMMIVTDYVRRADEASGQCISGYYYREFQKLLREANYPADKCYRTSVIKRYYKGLGAGNWGSDKKLLKRIFEEEGYSEDYYLSILFDEIKQIKPRVIIASGEYALRTLTDHEGIGKWRGSVVPLRESLRVKLEPPANRAKVVCFLHPSDIQVDESNVYIMRMDAKKAVEQLYSDKPIDYHQITIAKSVGDVIRFRNIYKNPPRMVSDIETRFGFITCASVSYDGYRGLCIPMFGCTNNPKPFNIDGTENARMQYVLALDLENHEIAKGNQNIDYDQRIYQRFGFTVNNIVWDTMLAAHTIATEFPKRLGFLTSIYTDMSYYKDDSREAFEGGDYDLEKFYNYNAKDSISTFQIWDKQIEELKEMELYEFFVDFIMPLYHVYYRMESIGWKIDFSKRQELLAKYEGFRELKSMELRVLCDKDINVHSPQQVARYLDENSFPVYKHRTPGGNMVTSTGVNEMKKMRSRDPNDFRRCKIPYEHAIRFIDLTLLIRRIDKVIEYVTVGVHPYGRVHTNVNISGTGSGRTSGSQTSDGVPLWIPHRGELRLKFDQCGQSFQTVTKHGFIIEGEEDVDSIGDVIGKDLREMYVPDTDMIIVEGDGSQDEARIVDVLAEDWDGLAEYGKIDKHCKVASMIFTDYSYDDIVRLSKKQKTEEGLFMRFIGKKGKHANNLGVGEYVLSMTANISITMARNVLKKLDKAYPNTKAVFHDGVEKFVRDNRCLWNPFGRKRYFFKKVDGHYIKVWYSWLPQSICSDNTKRSLLEIDSKIDRDKAWLLAENHDSITALVRRGYLRNYIRIFKSAFEKPIDMRKCSLPRDYQLSIPTEFSIGRRNWGTIKEIKKLNLARL